MRILSVTTMAQSNNVVPRFDNDLSMKSQLWNQKDAFIPRWPGADPKSASPHPLPNLNSLSLSCEWVGPLSVTDMAQSNNDVPKLKTEWYITSKNPSFEIWKMHLYHGDLVQIQGVRLLILGLVLVLICIAGLLCRCVSLSLYFLLDSSDVCMPIIYWTDLLVILCDF